MTRALEHEVDSSSLAGLKDLRVAVVHDYLNQRGGAERVALALMEALPGARLITSVYDPARTFPEFQRYQVETTWLDRVPYFRADARRAMPLLARAFSGLHVDDVDLVVCSSSGWSHGVRTTAPKIVYCHNPARWLYQPDEYARTHGLFAKAALTLTGPALRGWDKRAAGSVSTYLANSSTVASRIRQTYGVEASVLAPPVTIDPRLPQAPVAGVDPHYFLTVNRARSYKNADVVCRAVEAVTGARLVVVGDLPEGNWSSRIQAVADVSDAELRWLYAHARGVLAASHEDFGLTPVEGYVFGKPAVCLRAGGFLDTMREGTTGLFFDEPTAASMTGALLEFERRTWDADAIAAHGRRFDGREFVMSLEDEIDRLRDRIAGAPVQ